MLSILGDKTIISLLNLTRMEPQKKKELIELLPAMNEEDRRDVFLILYQLFAIQTENKIAFEEAKMLRGKLNDPQSFDWKKFAEIEENVLKETISRSG